MRGCPGGGGGQKEKTFVPPTDPGVHGDAHCFTAMDLLYFKSWRLAAVGGWRLAVGVGWRAVLKGCP